MKWNIARLDKLSPIVVHGILKLRAEIFVVEQNCAYMDPDDKDLHSYHLYAQENGNIHAYTRIVDPGISYSTPAIGRVVVSQKFRRTGLGKELMKKSIEHASNFFPGKDITISAQYYLEKFYSELGFITASGQYLEDDIPHVKMVLKSR